jgi:hypothetical protein
MDPQNTPNTLTLHLFDPDAEAGGYLVVVASWAPSMRICLLLPGSLSKLLLMMQRVWEADSASHSRPTEIAGFRRDDAWARALGISAEAVKRYRSRLTARLRRAARRVGVDPPTLLESLPGAGHRLSAPLQIQLPLPVPADGGSLTWSLLADGSQ